MLTREEAARELVEALRYASNPVQIVLDFLIEREQSDTDRPVVLLPPEGLPLDEIERLAIMEALSLANGVLKDAAELLSISPRVMYYKIKMLGIRRPRADKGTHG